MTYIYVIMGVSGCGKSTVGAMAAKTLGLPFVEGDDYHSPEAVAKMRSGTPLTDEDRMPWADRMIEACQGKAGDEVILACSALSRRFRKRLRGKANGHMMFIHLHGSPRIIRNRLAARQGHYFKVDMLASQYEALQMPLRAVSLDILDDPESLAAQVVDIVKARRASDQQ